MRYVIYGAGAVGGVIASRLAQHRRDVVVIARGANLEALASRGARIVSPDGDDQVALAAVGHPGDVAWHGDEVVVLAMKTQDTESAVVELAATAPDGVAVVCAQNGVENERLALRRFPRVYGMCVMLPASHLDPGVFVAHFAGITGNLDLGLAAGGTDDTAAAVAAELSASGFSSFPHPAIMRWKYCKLLLNLTNAADALCGSEAVARSDLGRRARAEAVACYQAAGIDYASVEEDRERRKVLSGVRPIEGHPRVGSSTWQSLYRGSPTEADFLNGEIVLLGRLHGVPTPVNAGLQLAMVTAARRGVAPGSVSLDELEELMAPAG